MSHLTEPLSLLWLSLVKDGDMLGGSLSPSQSRAGDFQYLILKNISFFAVFRLEIPCKRVSQVVLTFYIEDAFYVEDGLFMLSKTSLLLKMYQYILFYKCHCSLYGKRSMKIHWWIMQKLMETYVLQNYRVYLKFCCQTSKGDNFADLICYDFFFQWIEISPIK